MTWPSVPDGEATAELGLPWDTCVRRLSGDGSPGVSSCKGSAASAPAGGGGWCGGCCSAEVSPLCSAAACCSAITAEWAPGWGDHTACARNQSRPISQNQKLHWSIATMVRDDQSLLSAQVCTCSLFGQQYKRDERLDVIPSKFLSQCRDHHKLVARQKSTCDMSATVTVPAKPQLENQHLSIAKWRHQTSVGALGHI